MMKTVFRHLGWKLFSIGAAFALWYAYSGARDLTTSISVPVQYRNVASDLEISSDIAEQVHLILRGPSPMLSRLNGASMPLVIDLSDVRSPGERTITVSRRNVSLPGGVTLERAVPAQVRLRLETKISREVPVHVRMEQLAPDQQVENVEVIPDRLTIVGPRSEVDKIERVETDAVDPSAADRNHEVKVAVFSGNPQVHFPGPPPLVTVKIKLSGETNKK